MATLTAKLTLTSSNATSDTLNLTEWINTKDDGKVVHKLQERKPKAM